MSVYCHAALPNDQSVRLLTLNPRENDAPLRGQLVPVNIEDATDYEALSYAWGDPAGTERIVCNSSELMLTSSVYYALLRLRIPLTPRPSLGGLDLCRPG